MAVKKKYDRNVLGRGLDSIGTGRGLDALIDTSDIQTKGTSNLNEIPIKLIEPNPNQPRREFDESAMKELAASIREIGLITPITVRQTEEGTYQIIAGERRWRASQMAGLESLPAYIKTAADDDVMEMALVENIQREDLNAIEIALAYQHLSDTLGLTQERISERVGKSRTSVTNYMRLLKLPAPIQMALKNKEMDMPSRLFFGTEFSVRTGLFIGEEKYVLCNQSDRGADKIVENNGGQAVYDSSEKNHLAKKNDFAEAVKNEINSQINGRTDIPVLVEAQDLEYISSAGLRVLLQLRKNHPDFCIVDVSPEVYEILDVTGFTQMMDPRLLKVPSLRSFPEGMPPAGTLY